MHSKPGRRTFALFPPHTLARDVVMCKDAGTAWQKVAVPNLFLGQASSCTIRQLDPGVTSRPRCSNFLLRVEASIFDSLAVLGIPKERSRRWPAENRSLL